MRFAEAKAFHAREIAAEILFRSCVNARFTPRASVDKDSPGPYVSLIELPLTHEINADKPSVVICL